MTNEATVVMVIWNALEYTKVSVESSFKTTKTPINLVLVDNDSDKTIVDFLMSLIPPQNFSLKLILNRNNLGIGRTYNQGLEESLRLNSKYTVFCNNDLLFSNNCIEK